MAQLRFQYRVQQIKHQCPWQRYGPPEAASDPRVVGSLLCFEHDIQLARAKLAWLERAKTVLRTRAMQEGRAKGQPAELEADYDSEMYTEQELWL